MDSITDSEIPAVDVPRPASTRNSWPMRPDSLAPYLRIAAVVALLVVAASLAYTRLFWVRRQEPDFEFFFRAGAALLTHGSFDNGMDRLPDGTVSFRGTIEWYPPFVSRLMTLPAAISGFVFGTNDGPLQPSRTTSGLLRTPFRLADAIWLSLNVIALVAVARLLGRHFLKLPENEWPAWLLAPLAVIALFLHWEFRLNQIDLITLLLMVGSFVCWERGKRGVAGFWLGLAVLLKITPALLIVWFGLKRQWRTAVAAIVTISLAGPVADVVVFGPDYAGDVYRAWFRKAAAASQSALILDGREMDWRNQGLGAVLARMLSETSGATHFDNDPRAERFNDPPRFHNFASLSPPTVALLATAAVLASLAGLAWTARRPASRMSADELRLEWSLFLLAMLWCMPVLRRYHLIWTLPAVSLLLMYAYQGACRTTAARSALAGVSALAATQLALLTKALTASDVAEAYGVFLIGLLLLTISAIIVRRGVRRATAESSRALVDRSRAGDGASTSRAAVVHG